MSVTSQVPYQQFVAAPGATLFSSGFRVILSSDLVVRVDGVPVTSGFTISGLNQPGGVDVTFGTPMVGGEVVELQRRVPLVRLVDYQQSGDFLSPVVNGDFDRIVMMLQDQQFLSNLAILLPLGDPLAPMTIPGVAERASKFFAFDALGQAIATSVIAGVPVSDFIATLLDDNDDAAARATLGAQVALVSGVNIKTINGISVLGGGDITIAAGSSNSTGLYSARPSAATAGAGWIYYATDTQEAYRSDGATWTVVGGKTELGYAERASTFSTASTTMVDVTGLTFTAVAGERPMVLEFQGHVNNAGGSGRACIFGLYANGALIQGEKVFWMNGTTNYQTTYARARIAAGVLTPGTTYTFKLMMRTDANTGSLFADAAWQPFLRLESV